VAAAAAAAGKALQPLDGASSLHQKLRVLREKMTERGVYSNTSSKEEGKAADNYYSSGGLGNMPMPPAGNSTLSHMHMQQEQEEMPATQIGFDSRSLRHLCAPASPPARDTTVLGLSSPGKVVI
jgi:hypothetical protein